MELVLYYHPLPLADPSRLRSILAAHGAELRVVSHPQLCRPLGELAGLSGLSVPPSAREYPRPAEPVMVFCGSDWIRCWTLSRRAEPPPP